MAARHTFCAHLDIRGGSVGRVRLALWACTPTRRSSRIRSGSRAARRAEPGGRQLHLVDARVAVSLVGTCTCDFLVLCQHATNSFAGCHSHIASVSVSTSCTSASPCRCTREHFGPSRHLPDQRTPSHHVFRRELTRSSVRAIVCAVNGVAPLLSPASRVTIADRRRTALGQLAKR